MDDNCSFLPEAGVLSFGAACVIDPGSTRFGFRFPQALASKTILAPAIMLVNAGIFGGIRVRLTRGGISRGNRALGKFVLQLISAAQDLNSECRI
jgi:hypothetical protein